MSIEYCEVSTFTYVLEVILVEIMTHYQLTIPTLPCEDVHVEGRLIQIYL